VSKPTVQAVAHDDLVGLRDAAKTSGEVDRVADDADMCATEWPKFDHLQIAGRHRDVHAGRWLDLVDLALPLDRNGGADVDQRRPAAVAAARSRNATGAWTREGRH